MLRSITMSANNNNNSNTLKNVGMGTSLLGNSGAMRPQTTSSNHQPHLLSQSQQPAQGSVHFPGHFHLSDAQSHVLNQGQFTQPHVLNQGQFTQAHVLNQAHGRTQSHAQSHPPPHLQNSNTNNVATSSNANVSSPSVHTPGSGSAKRSAQRPPSRPSGSSNPSTATPLKTMELAPAAPRKKQKLSGKDIPKNVAALLPESALYMQLLEYEARVDAIMARKKVDIEESFKSPPRIQKTLRVYVFNTFANQMETSSDNKDCEPPSWSLKIVGRLLEDGKDPVMGGSMQKPSSPVPKFSYFFKRITIYLDQSINPNNHLISWESDRSPALNEGLEVKRTGNKEFTAVIRLEMNHRPEKFKLSSALANVLGFEIETRPRILNALWFYIKSSKLQSPSDPTFFICDPPLQKVFGEEKVKFSVLSQMISQHLSTPQPIHLEHKIKLSGNSPSGTTCYDVLVDVPFQLEKEMSTFLENVERQEEIDAYDEVIKTSIKRIHEHYRRRAFFLAFSQSPAEFINTLIASQSKDLKLAIGDASHNVEKERSSDFYNQPWVEDAVIRYLNRKSAGSDAL